jgi:hypothetical protein
VHTPSLLWRFSGVRLAPAWRCSGGGPSLVRRSAAKGEIRAERRAPIFEGFGRVFVTRSKYPLGCLGLLKKHRSQTPPARPISTSICASKSTSIYTTICATTWTSSEASFLCSDRQNPVLRPVPATRIPECAQAVKGWPRQRPPPKAARSRTQPKGRARRASLTAEHMKGEAKPRRGHFSRRMGCAPPYPTAAECSAEYRWLMRPPLP